MVLTVRQALKFAEDATGGPLPVETGGRALLARAGSVMESARDWLYMRRTTKALMLRPQVSGSSAVYEPSDKSVTLANAFDGYTFVPGDTISLLLSGSSAGTYGVVSRDSGNKLITDSTIEAGPVAVDFTMDTGRIALPSDFGRMDKVYGKESFVRQTFAASTSELLLLDSTALTGEGFTTGYAIEWNQATDVSQPVPTLRLWPEPSALDFEGLMATYYRAFPEFTSDDDLVPIPPFMETLYLQYVRAFALGYDGGGPKYDLDDALMKVRGGIIFRDAASRDAATQRNRGRLEVRAVRRAGGSGQFDPLNGSRTESWFNID